MLLLQEIIIYGDTVNNGVLTSLSTRWLLEQAKNQKKSLIIANIIALVATLISVPIPLLMPLMVDEVLLNKPEKGIAFFNYLLPESLQHPASYIVVVLVLVLVMRIVSQALNIWQNRQFILVSKTITCYVRQQLLDKLGRVSIKEFEQRGSGGLSSYLVTDIETLDNFIGNSLSRFVVGVLTVFGTAIILLWLDWRLGLFILLVNPLVIFLSRKMGRRVKHLKKAENQSFERFQQRLVETLDGIYQLRAANRDKAYLDILKEDAEFIRHDADRYAWQTEAAGRISFLMFLIGFELFRAAAMLMVLFSDLSIGQIFAVFGYLWFMLSPIQELLDIQYAWFSASAAMKRLNGLLVLEEEFTLVTSSADPLVKLDTFGVEVRDLTFAYDDDKTVLNGLSLSLPAGKRVALVGASGGGKSTLIQLLLGLYRKSSGDILIDGKPVESIGYETLRQHTAVVLQQPVIFNDTLYANLTLGRDDFTEAQLWQSLDIAQLSDVVDKLKTGLNSQLGHHGLKLSGGQRQRLAIARMILSNPKLVIMDEATSALDTATEAALHQALNNFLQGRTTLIVAHRLSAVKEADLIYVLEDGKVAQSGIHHDLVNIDGVYQTLYGNLQAG